VTFFQGEEPLPSWTRITRTAKRAKLGVKHVLASSAIPIFFPAVEVDGDWYGDGCIRLGTPLSPAIRMGANRIVAIAVRHAPDPRPPIESSAPYPTPAEETGVLLDALFLDALETDVERALRINRTLSFIPDEVLASHVLPLRHVDLLVLRPSRDLGSLVLSTLDRFPAAVRHLFRGLGASDVTGWDLLSYLAFDGSYATRLLELGYEDTVARADEIRRFLA
jgi:NTE family protein